MRTIICQFPEYTTAQVLTFETLGVLGMALIFIAIISGVIGLHVTTSGVHNTKILRKWLLIFGASIPLAILHFSKLLEFQLNSLWYNECHTAGYYYGWYAVHLLGALCFINFHRLIISYHRRNKRLNIPNFFKGMLGES